MFVSVSLSLFFFPLKVFVALEEGCTFASQSPLSFFLHAIMQIVAWNL